MFSFTDEWDATHREFFFVPHQAFCARDATGNGSIRV